MSTSEGDIMKMRQQNSMTIPANGRLELKPGGAHLVFVGLKQPFKESDTVPLTLRFEGAGALKTELHVQGR
jgi:copper(I)-binding protein